MLEVVQQFMTGVDKVRRFPATLRPLFLVSPRDLPDQVFRLQEHRAEGRFALLVQ